MSLKKLNDIIPLVATIECPDGDTFYVRAFITDENNVLIAAIDLEDQGGGLFTKYTFLMPNNPLINVRYVAYEDPGYSQQAEDICPESEVFCLFEVSNTTVIQMNERPRMMSSGEDGKKSMSTPTAARVAMRKNVDSKKSMKMINKTMAMMQIDSSALPFEMEVLQ